MLSTVFWLINEIYQDVRKRSVDLHESPSSFEMITSYLKVPECAMFTCSNKSTQA